MPDTLEDLRALERQVEREWWWLNGALHAVAQMRSERLGGSLANFREMQEQAREVDCRRVQIATRIAALVGPAVADQTCGVETCSKCQRRKVVDYHVEPESEEPLRDQHRRTAAPRSLRLWMASASSSSPVGMVEVAVSVSASFSTDEPLGASSTTAPNAGASAAL